jgi:secreted trypsin-like serine protease
VKKYSLIFSLLLFSFTQFVWANTALQARIINGNTTTEAQIPWQVALIASPLDPYQSYFCSGSLVADRWVVTAAHCIEQFEKQNVIIMFWWVHKIYKVSN